MIRPSPFAAVLLALAACSGSAVDRAPPIDAFYFPESLAVRHLDAAGGDCLGGAPGCTTQLLVVSTNFDLRYDSDRGGTLLSIAVPPDPATRPKNDEEAARHPRLDVRGAVRIGSLGGTLALLEDRPTVTGGSERLCPGWSTAADPSRTPQALVASRVTRRLHRVGLRGDLGLDCEGGCAVSLDDATTSADDRYRDPYGVGVVCRGEGEAYRAEAFVTFLSTPGNAGVLGRVSLPTGALLSPLDVGSDAAHTAAYDAASDRLFFTGRFTGPGYVPFRYLELGNSRGGDARVDARVIDLAQQVRGAETRGFSFSEDRTRAYVALRLYDADLATRVGARPPDVGGAIGIIDTSPDLFGSPAGKVLAVVPVGLAPTDVKVIPRPGRRGVVVASCSGDDTVWIYDDESGALAKVFARGDAGPLMGSQPAGLAVEARSDGHFRIYVAAFGSNAVSAIDLDPSAPSQALRFMVLGGPLP